MDVCICIEYVTSPCPFLQICSRASSCFQLSPCLKGNILSLIPSGPYASPLSLRHLPLSDPQHKLLASAEARGPQLHAAICFHFILWSLKTPLLQQEIYGSKKRDHIPHRMDPRIHIPSSCLTGTWVNELSLKLALQQLRKVVDPNKAETKRTETVSEMKYTWYCSCEPDICNSYEAGKVHFKKWLLWLPDSPDRTKQPLHFGTSQDFP